MIAETQRRAGRVLRVLALAVPLLLAVVWLWTRPAPVASPFDDALDCALAPVISQSEVGHKLGAASSSQARLLARELAQRSVHYLGARDLELWASTRIRAAHASKSACARLWKGRRGVDWPSHRRAGLDRAGGVRRDARAGVCAAPGTQAYAGVARGGGGRARGLRRSRLSYPPRSAARFETDVKRRDVDDARACELYLTLGNGAEKLVSDGAHRLLSRAGPRASGVALGRAKVRRAGGAAVVSPLSPARGACGAMGQASPALAALFDSPVTMAQFASIALSASRRGWTRVLAVVRVWLGSLLLMASACNSRLPSSLDGKACLQGRCLTGYVCEPVTNQCVRASTLFDPSPSPDLTCEVADVVCDGSCVDTASDASHCGGCGATCSAPVNGVGICLGGACNFVCNKSFSPCGKGCADLLTDREHCGACGHQCTSDAAADAACVGGVCVVACRAPWVDCGGACVDVSSDPAHCGACERACLGDEVCSNGACSDSCSGGTANCDGACVDLSISPEHCGACATRCGAPDGGVGVCANASCAFACNPGRTACDGVCADTATDENNCGACGKLCDSPAHGSASCAGGVCQTSCDAGFADCAGSCTKTSNDPTNCGACGHACASAEVCSDGVCQLTCPAGLKTVTVCAPTSPTIRAVAAPATRCAGARYGGCAVRVGAASWPVTRATPRVVQSA